ncbi:hypothetical protein [Streptomyces sp. NPDC006140]|uniref:hypothetical protein n=1 Tax=Streptomyces sp. NPDC006140 TaxID=3154579 RepID=UPI0033DD3255
MSGRGRKAVPPPPDHHVEPPLGPDGLVVTVTNKAGFKKEYDFAELPVPEPMQRSLAELFAEASKGWNSILTAKSYWRGLLGFARFLSGSEDSPEDLDDLTAALLKRWRAKNIGTSTGRNELTKVRLMLKRDPRLTTGAAAEELARRIPGAQPSKQSYEEDERNQVVLTAQRQFRSAWMRICENTRLLESWRAGRLVDGSREWQLGEVLDQLARTGNVPHTIYPSGQSHVKNHRLLGGRGPIATWGRLFLDRQELTSLAVLLTDRFGWNLSVYDRMPTPISLPSAGEKTSVTYQVQLEKRRAGEGRWFSMENITDSGADSAGRLISQALEATAHGRALAARLSPGTDLLMIARMHQPARHHQDPDRPRPVGPLSLGVGQGDARFWAESHKLTGSPFQRSRRTTVTREGRPLQHTQGTHESVYVLPDKRIQRASREVFEAGALAALEQAQTAVFAGSIKDRANPAHQETVTADCEDESTSPWPAPEGGCGASFLLCLGCRNAHVHPGHHSRLAYLHQTLESLRSALDDRAWAAVWHDPHLRLKDLRKKIGPTAWNAALARVSDADRALVQLLVEGKFAP